MSCGNNLKQIGLALHHYHDDYGSFPPAFVADEHGTPMHSWRVLILPYLEQSQLYEQYRFDEPWDGPNNRKLAKKFPPPYRCASFQHNVDHNHVEDPGDEFVTNYVAVIGPRTVFDGDQAISIEDINGGTSSAIMVADVHLAVPWMKPDDISPDELFSLLTTTDEETLNHPGGMQFLLADGTVQFHPSTLAAEIFRALTNIGESAPEVD